MLQDDAEVSVPGTGGGFGLAYDEYDNPVGGAFTTDLSNEVVLAYRDNNSELRVQVVRGDQLATPNSIYAYYGGDPTYGRGAVSHVAVATGDLDGDGHKNEIVAAFKDSNKDLQVIVFKMQDASTLPARLQMLWRPAACCFSTKCPSSASTCSRCCGSIWTLSARWSPSTARRAA